MILRINGKNVTNRRYWAAADLSGVFPGMPFTLYASATFEF
jgi:outer membrane receptor protein involved in Fe transport